MDGYEIKQRVDLLSEIEENDFNLNIPRYVDTFEPEEPIDLPHVAEQLTKLDEVIAKTEKEITGFCKELGLPTPF